MNTHAITRAAVRKILENAEAYSDWSLQGFGMLRLYLTPQVRLHIWDDRFMIPDVSTIHDHPWDFRSYIVSGRVHQHRYELVGNIAAGQPYMMQRIRCGPGGCAVDPPVKVSLLAGHLETYARGQWYEQQADEIHSSEPERGTVTLVERHFKSDTEHARVFYRTEKWVSAEPRRAELNEVKTFVQIALEGWDR